MSRVQKSFVRFKHSEHGSVVPFFALAATGIVCAAGAAISYAYLVETRTRYQNSIDAAVLAGVTLAEGATNTDRIDTARRVYFANLGYFARKGNTNLGSNIDLTSEEPGFKIDGTTVFGRTSASIKNIFPIIGSEYYKISVNAAAKKAYSIPICVLGLNATAAGAFAQSGASVFTATNCAAQFNSRSLTGMLQQGQPTAQARAFGVSGKASGSSFSPLPVSGASPISDPFASLVFPEIGPCIGAASKFTSAKVTLYPGTYCGGIDVKAGTELTMSPGVYIMKDGNFTVQSGSVVNGSEVMIAFIGEAGNWPATLMLLGGATMSVTSPLTGPYAGVQFFGARETYTKMGWPSIGGAGSAATTLIYDGLMYFPTQDVWIYGGAKVTAKSPTLAVVTEELWVQDNANLTVMRDNSRNVSISTVTPTLDFGAVLVR